MTEWNDGRLDDLSRRVDTGFACVDQQFERVHAEIQGIHARFDGLQRALTQMTMMVIAALIGLITTQV